MSKFSVTDETFDYIRTKFNIAEESIRELFDSFQNLKELNTAQYLAHVMRSLEHFVREKQNAPFFRITCSSSSDNPLLKKLGCASYKEKRYFRIVYDSSLDTKSARVVIAHELGHLFWIVLTGRKYEESHEPISSIFGIFTILDKNDFYENRTKELQHKSQKDIIDDFSLLKKRLDEEYNIS